MESFARNKHLNVPQRRLRKGRRQAYSARRFFSGLSVLLKPTALAGLVPSSWAAARLELYPEDTRLGFLIHDVSRMRRSAYDQFLKPLDITRAQWWVLAHLSRHDGMAQTQLADELEVGKASLGSILESLESGGWIVRRPDLVDKRVKRIYLLRSALSLIKRTTVMEAQLNDQILGKLSPPERTELSRMLMTVKQAISEFKPAAGVHEAG